MQHHEWEPLILCHRNAKFGGQKYRIEEIKLLQFVARPCDQSAISLYGWKLLKISHHPPKFSDHRDCGDHNSHFLGGNFVTKY